MSLMRNLNDWWRLAAIIMSVGALVFGGILAMQDKDGIATTSVFVVALVFGAFAIMGVIPTTVEFGDVKIALEVAKAMGQKAGMVEGLELGVHAAASIAMASSPEDAQECINKYTITQPQLKQYLEVVQKAAQADPKEWREGAKPIKPLPGRDLMGQVPS